MGPKLLLDHSPPLIGRIGLWWGDIHVATVVVLILFKSSMRMWGNSRPVNVKSSRPGRSPAASPIRSSDLHSSTMHERNSDPPDCWSNLVAISRNLSVSLLGGCNPTSDDYRVGEWSAVSCHSTHFCGAIRDPTSCSGDHGGCVSADLCWCSPLLTQWLITDIFSSAKQGIAPTIIILGVELGFTSDEIITHATSPRVDFNKASQRHTPTPLAAAKTFEHSEIIASTNDREFMGEIKLSHLRRPDSREDAREYDESV